jgi:hypothetical protein
MIVARNTTAAHDTYVAGIPLQKKGAGNRAFFFMRLAIFSARS